MACRDELWGVDLHDDVGVLGVLFTESLPDWSESL
jgi:hypothetical protein